MPWLLVIILSFEMATQLRGTNPGEAWENWVHLLAMRPMVAITWRAC